MGRLPARLTRAVTEGLKEYSKTMAAENKMVTFESLGFKIRELAEELLLPGEENSYLLKHEVGSGYHNSIVSRICKSAGIVPRAFNPLQKVRDDFVRDNGEAMRGEVLQVLDEIKATLGEEAPVVFYNFDETAFSSAYWPRRQYVPLGHQPIPGHGREANETATLGCWVNSAGKQNPKPSLHLPKGYSGRTAKTQKRLQKVIEAAGDAFHVFGHRQTQADCWSRCLELGTIEVGTAKVLIWDRAPTHRLSNAEKIALKALDIYVVQVPGKTTKWFQPLDVAGPFRSIKAALRRRLAESEEDRTFFDAECYNIILHYLAQYSNRDTFKCVPGFPN